MQKYLWSSLQPISMSSIPWTHVVERENWFSQVVFGPPHAWLCQETCPHTMHLKKCIFRECLLSFFHLLFIIHNLIFFISSPHSSFIYFYYISRIIYLSFVDHFLPCSFSHPSILSWKYKLNCMHFVFLPENTSLCSSCPCKYILNIYSPEETFDW